MKWLLVVFMLWADGPPLSTLQIPVATKDLCEQAAAQVRKDLSAAAVSEALEALGRGFVRSFESSGGLVTSCLQISN